ncbi:Peptidase aspartic [Ophiocordyceps sinensis CO18]|uniref:Peptidase aspartic n=1 Tax=Ophiocordyceps sinensis (strain Co18 / CGMCC 3.14243) TaxID=911162 RepID=T5A5E7_OPHSC|nr:Peptidase aspartic [Ophiocordyceps sinensis CO18]
MAGMTAASPPPLVAPIVLLLLHLVTSIMARNCVPGPVSLPIVNVTLATGKTRRGIAVNVGQPGQQFAFLPRWGNNNTFLYGPECDSLGLVDTNDACITFRGGLYDPAKGGPAPLGNNLVEPWNSKTYSMFTDTLDLGNNISLADFPIASPVNVTDWNLQGYDPQNMIGLGSASSLIQALRKKRQIASSAVGFYWGLDGVNDRDQRPGAFVLGGYDKAKTYGPGHTAFLSDTKDCESGMMVSLRDIVLNFANGTDASIFSRENGGTLLRACLIPERPVVMDMPLKPYFANLLDKIGNVEAGRSNSVDWWNVILDGTLPIFSGSLSFVLESGLQIKIPNHQLIVPERRIEAGGGISVNDSRPALRINSLQSTTSQSLPLLGRYFFTGAYVMANRDANQFTLWEANPTSEENLVAVNDKNEVFPATAKGSCARQPTASLKPDGANSGGSGASVSPGAMAGIAVGGAAAIVAAAALTWWLLRRKREAKATQPEPTFENGRDKPLQSPKQDPHHPLPHLIPHELSSGATQRQPAEMLA